MLRIEVAHVEEVELKALLAELRVAQRSLDGLALRIAARSNRLATQGKAAPAADTMRGDGSVPARQARREAARAAVAEQIKGLADAVANGQISGDHIDSIARHHSRLPVEERGSFNFASLIGRAAGMPPETFDRLVKRKVDETIGDHGLKDTMSKQQASEFTHWFDHTIGMGRFAGSLDPERYEALTNAVDRHVSLLAARDKGVTKTKNLAARALVELATGGTPASGTGRDARSRASVTVIVDQRTMAHGPHERTICQTEQGHDLPHQSVTRLCCDAILRRVVIDERGVPIDVGRQHRTATDGQWAALKAMHSTCAWGDCTAPISWCQAHHILEWEKGGRTNLDNLIPLCSRHHHRVHEGQWHVKLKPDRTLQILRPDGSLYTTVPTPMRC